MTTPLPAFVVSSRVSDAAALANGTFRASISGHTGNGAFTLTLRNDQTGNQVDLKSVENTAAHSAALDIAKFPGVSHLTVTLAANVQAPLVLPVLADISAELNKKDILFT